MRALFTGGSSPLGMRVLQCVLDSEQYDEVWCSVHEQHVTIKHPKLRILRLSLEEPVDLREIPEPLNQVIHFAATTHSGNEQEYWQTNLRGTVKLMEAARARGCQRFFFVSTRCATEGSGAYAESKRAAELELQKVDWESLVILRPAEIYGLTGTEGVDRLLKLGKRFHVVPLLWGSRKVQFAPLHGDDFTAIACALLMEPRRGVHILDVCGPENLSGAEIASRIARGYGALPIPLWWPAFRLILRGLQVVGVYAVNPDQIRRLEGSKTAYASSNDDTLNRPMKRFLHE